MDRAANDYRFRMLARAAYTAILKEKEKEKEKRNARNEKTDNLAAPADRSPDRCPVGVGAV